MSKRERITLRLDAEAESIEGYLFSYLKHNPAILPREAILRALKAFYLLWALERSRSESELKLLAKTLLEELQFRMLQIQQRFLESEDSSVLFRALAVGANLRSLESERTQTEKMLMPAPPETFFELVHQLDSQELNLDEF